MSKKKTTVVMKTTELRLLFINLEIEVVEISDSVEGGKRDMTVEASENKIYLYIIVDDDSNNNTEDE